MVVVVVAVVVVVVVVVEDHRIRDARTAQRVNAGWGQAAHSRAEFIREAHEQPRWISLEHCSTSWR